jgi:hypothetical protein
MNKITELVSELMKTSEFKTNVMGKYYEPFEEDFIDKFDDRIEHYYFYSQLAPLVNYQASDDECLPEYVVDEIKNEIDWDVVKDTWADYNRC